MLLLYSQYMDISSLFCTEIQINQLDFKQRFLIRLALRDFFIDFEGSFTLQIRENIFFANTLQILK